MRRATSISSALITAALILLGTGSAQACSPIPPLSIEDLEALPALTENMTMLVGDAGAVAIAGVYERFHYDFVEGSPVVSAASLSAVTRYWGQPPTDAGIVKHGGLRIDDTDTCGTPSGKARGTAEFFVVFHDGLRQELVIDQLDTGRLDTILGPAVVLADPETLLAPSPTVQTDHPSGGLGPVAWSVLGLVGGAVAIIGARRAVVARR